MKKDFALYLLKEVRRGKESSGFYFEGDRWASDQKDERRLNGALALFTAEKVFNLNDLPSIENYKINEFKEITLTPEIAAKASLTMMRHFINLHAIEKQKRAEIQAGPDVVEESVIFEGWYHVQ